MNVNDDARARAADAERHYQEQVKIHGCGYPRHLCRWCEAADDAQLRAALAVLRLDAGARS